MPIFHPKTRASNIVRITPSGPSKTPSHKGGHADSINKALTLTTVNPSDGGSNNRGGLFQAALVHESRIKQGTRTKQIPKSYMD